jgi:pilus assembly protein Flp/PilA
VLRGTWRSSPRKGQPFQIKDRRYAKSISYLLAGLRRLLFEETAQDLVEYALLVALIAFGTTAGMKALGTGTNATFSHISTTLAAQ